MTIVPAGGLVPLGTRISVITVITNELINSDKINIQPFTDVSENFYCKVNTLTSINS